MATVAYHIISDYNPEDRKRLEIETGQLDPEAGTGIDIPQHDDADPWSTEKPFGTSKRVTNPPKFVAATIKYDQWGPESISCNTGTPAQNETEKSGDEEKSVGSWYRSLVKTSRSSTLTPSSSSKQSTPSIGPLSQDLHTQKTQGAPIPSSHHGIKKDRNNWFITRALEAASLSKTSTNESQISIPSTPSGSGYGTPSYSTLADMLARDPPPMPTEAQYTPPVWLSIGPSNKGFSMLEKRGWREGEAIGRASRARNGLGYGINDKGKQKETLGSDTTDRFVVQQQVIDLSYVDDRIIDLTTMDDEDEAQDEIRGSSALSVENFSPQTKLPQDIPLKREGDEEEDIDYGHDYNHNQDLDHNPHALLTPLPTILKADRLGIGLKAKMTGSGIHKAPIRRVTHSQSAIAAHIRSSEALKRVKRSEGRGRRGFERIKKKEEDRRRNLMAYLNN